MDRACNPKSILDDLSSGLALPRLGEGVHLRTVERVAPAGEGEINPVEETELEQVLPQPLWELCSLSLAGDFGELRKRLLGREADASTDAAYDHFLFRLLAFSGLHGDHWRPAVTEKKIEDWFREELPKLEGRLGSNPNGLRGFLVSVIRQFGD